MNTAEEPQTGPSTEASPEAETAATTPDEYSLQRAIDFARAMPKCELHLHAEGAISPEIALRIGARNDTSHLLPFKTVEEGLAQYNFANLGEFIKVIDTVILVLRRRQDFYDYAMDYLDKGAEQNVKHVDFQFSPQVIHEDAKRDEMIFGLRDAVRDGEKRFGITSTLTLALVRTFSLDSAIECINHVAAADPSIVTAIGLVGYEVGHPPSKFTEAFAHARRVFGEGLKYVMHAGEEGPSSYISEALELGAERIDHGVAIQDSLELTEAFAENGVCIAMCPLSNLALKVVTDLKDHPLHRFLSKGLRVTINSDDPPFFSAYLNENYEACVHAFSLTVPELHQLALNSIVGSFASDMRQKEMIAQLDACYAKHK